MDRLEVASAELRMLSRRWHMHAAQLRVTTPPQSGMPCQPSAAAVTAGHAAIETVAASLIDSMTDKATRVATAGAGYTANEGDSAQRFTAISGRAARQ